MEFELSPAQRRLQDTARRLAESELASRAADIDRSEEYPWENVRLLKEAGFFGMTIPTEYGGRGLTYFDAVLVIE
jgi:3-sulfinopropanoyl-CoA desulfinase